MADMSNFICRQTTANTAISLVVGLPPFLIFFEIAAPIPVWGVGSYVFDFLPQGFMIALMSIVMPGRNALNAARRGVIVPFADVSVMSAGLARRALLFGAVGAGAGVGLAALTLALVGASEIGWSEALLAKFVFAGLLAAIVTPIGLRAIFSPH